MMDEAHSLYSVHRNFQIQAFHSARDSYWSPDFVFAGEVHDFWELMYVAEGTVEVTQDDRIYRLTAGELILHAPMKFHSIRSTESSSPHVLIITFSVQGYLPVKLGEGFFVLPQQEQTSCLQLLGQILAFVQGTVETHYAGQECADKLSAFLISLMNNHAVQEALFETHETYTYRELAAIMQKELYTNITMEEIAARLPVSHSHMKALFHRYAGMAPKHYYSRLRLTEAIRLMQDGLSPSETADRMNFSSPNYFSYFFKKMTGQPPSVYMKKYD